MVGCPRLCPHKTVRQFDRGQEEGQGVEPWV